MTQFNIVRYQGSKHITLVADPKLNEGLNKTIAITSSNAKLAEEAMDTQLARVTEGTFSTNIEDYKGFGKMDTKRLQALYEKTEKMLGAHEMIEEILIKRGVIQPKAKKAKTTKKETAPKDPKDLKEFKKCTSEECLQARLAEARKNYRRFCTFICNKTHQEETGIIRSARLDKRSGFIQYRIEIVIPLEDNKYERTHRVFGKADDSQDLHMLEFATSDDVAVEGENS